MYSYEANNFESDLVSHLNTLDDSTGDIVVKYNVRTTLAFISFVNTLINRGCHA